MAIETENHPKQVTRSRVEHATACYYPDSRRVILVADAADFGAAKDALAELSAHVLGSMSNACACGDRTLAGWHHERVRCYATGLEPK